jgi:hypothetical protein
VIERRFTLDEVAARKLKQAISSISVTPDNRSAGRKQSLTTVAKIEAHEGAGVYQAIEVFWDGAAWNSDANSSRKFGAVYGTLGIIHLAADTSVATNTIVRITPFHPTSAAGVATWFFQEGGGGGAYTGPFAVTYAGTTLTVGATRGGGVVDYIIVHPELLSKAAAETSAGVAAAGILYYTIVRGFLAAGGGAASATLAYAAGLPANTETTMYVPLATVTFAAGAITGVRQLQYGNIIIDKTVDVFCP